MEKSLSMCITVPVSAADVALLVTELHGKQPYKGLAHPLESYLDYCKTKCSVRSYLSEVHGLDISDEPDDEPEPAPKKGKKPAGLAGEAVSGGW